VVTRDDGAVAICSDCLVVVRGQPVLTTVSPSVVNGGKRTITVTGQHIQRVVEVTSSSSERAAVQSFKNTIGK
jgi:aerobic-type carbon monoxide dehydrogenase small subunit (CoxS/CutS family)